MSLASQTSVPQSSPPQAVESCWCRGFCQILVAEINRFSIFLTADLGEYHVTASLMGWAEVIPCLLSHPCQNWWTATSHQCYSCSVYLASPQSPLSIFTGSVMMPLLNTSASASMYCSIICRQLPLYSPSSYLLPRLHALHQIFPKMLLVQDCHLKQLFGAQMLLTTLWIFCLP